MNDLTPFVRHALPDKPNTSGAPENSCTRCSPPLGKTPPTATEKPQVESPPSQPDNPDVQLPPPISPAQTPHPDSGSAPTGGVPMTDGTPLPCHQKNAAEFLRGHSTGVMQLYAPGLFSTEQHTHAAQPAPEQDEAAVQSLVQWRENAPYG